MSSSAGAVFANTPALPFSSRNSVPRSHPRRAAIRAEPAVLRKGHELEVEGSPNMLAHFQEGLDGLEVRIRHIDMASDRQKPLGHALTAVGERARHNVFSGLESLEITPERNALQEGARCVDARRAIAERRIHVEVRVDEGARDQLSRGIHNLAGFGVDRRFDGSDLPVRDCDIGNSTIGKRSSLDQDVEGHVRPSLCVKTWGESAAQASQNGFPGSGESSARRASGTCALSSRSPGPSK